MAKEYDYLIVGAGIYGSTFACMAHRQGKRCLVVDNWEQISENNLYTGHLAENKYFDMAPIMEKVMGLFNI